MSEHTPEAPARIWARTKGQDGGGVWTTVKTGDTEYIRADLGASALEAQAIRDSQEGFREDAARNLAHALNLRVLAATTHEATDEHR